MNRRRAMGSDVEMALESVEKLDRTPFSIGSVSETSDERDYWLGKTPQERLQAVEWLRQINYGYDPATARLQRVLEVAELSES